MNSNVLYFFWFHMRLWLHNLQLMTYTVLNSLYIFKINAHIPIARTMRWSAGLAITYTLKPTYQKPFDIVWMTFNMTYLPKAYVLLMFNVPDKLSVFHKCQEKSLWTLCGWYMNWWVSRAFQCICKTKRRR